MENFKDKVVVVTGGAQGIGRCFADKFLKAGAHICVIDKQDGEHFVGDISKRLYLSSSQRKSSASMVMWTISSTYLHRETA